MDRNRKVFMLAFAGIVVVIAVLGIFFFAKTSEKPAPQTTQTQASLPLCLTDGSLPLPPDPHCYTCKSGHFKGQSAFAKKVGDGCETLTLPNGTILRSVKVGSGHDFACSWCPADAPTVLHGRGDENWTNCPAPMEGFCKSKGPTCTECRSGVARIICPCQINTPTPTKPVVTVPNCPRPQVITSVVISCPSCAAQ